jgi:hypothetical protein
MTGFNPMIDAITFNPNSVGKSMMFSSASGDVGSSLGECLANMDRYQSNIEFLKDFGATAAINGSISFLLADLPLIG